jgi:hypothetical protein
MVAVDVGQMRLNLGDSKLTVLMMVVASHVDGGRKKSLMLEGENGLLAKCFALNLW